jgi:hypothetical protein
MLGDNPEKSRNPLKKFNKRRKEKTVAFAEPTYFEASEQEYSSEEEDGEEGEYQTNGQVQNGQNGEAEHEQAQAQAQSQAQAQVTQPAPQEQDLIRTLDTVALVKEVQADPEPQVEHTDPQVDEIRSSQDTYDSQNDVVGGRIRKGVVRNTDSFFKDDSIETKKINLTPSILRDVRDETSATTSIYAGNQPQEVKLESAIRKYTR